LARPKLAVIVGAGASYDVCPDQGPILDPRWQPPIIATIFDSPAFDSVLARHPQADSIMSSIRTQMRSKRMTFEESLAYWMGKDDEAIKRKVLQVPIALHDYFLSVSEKYTREGINYSHLINCTVRDGVHTAFVTFNYDTLLEQSLTKESGGKFIDVQSYVGSADYLLVKLHGSVGWGYPWIAREGFQELLHSISGNSAALPAYRHLQHYDQSLPFVDRTQDVPLDARVLASFWSLPERHNSRIRCNADQSLMMGDILCYPALALPVPEKCEFICPPQHLEALAQFLADCENFLFIGFSARDDMFLNFLRKEVKAVRRFGVVTGEGEVMETVERLDEVTGLIAASEVVLGKDVFDKGFSRYMEYEIEAFVHTLKESA